MSSASAGTDKTHIVSTPDVLGGKPRIAGTRIRVQDIYQWHELQGKSPDEIVSSFPQLTMADVYAALAYFWDHREQILDQMRQQDETVEELKSRFPSKLPGRLRSQPGDNAISS
jgi:uncharacterized protein (DUF433 family)